LKHSHSTAFSCCLYTLHRAGSRRAVWEATQHFELC